MAHPLDPIVAAIRQAQRILVVTHVHPDGDALGSQLGLGAILADMGKEVVLYSEDQVSHLYDFLPGSAGLITELPAVGSFDCGIALDCGDEFRLGKAREELLTLHPFLVLDHHAGHREFGDLRWVDPHRASTGEMVYDLAQALGAEISALAAYCLYAAIVSDTGSFKYSSTTDETFRVARELLLKGVKPAEVAAKLFDNFSVNRLHLMKMVLDSLKLYADNRIAIIDAPSEVFLQTGATRDDAENFINFPRAINTVRVAAFLKEPEKGLVAVSLRSKGTDCDVANVAAQFGGGGHRNAAGFKMTATSIPAVRELLLKELLPLVAR
ncbi:MAG: DHH family phosphoesterase [Thermodesulfobacteriota bacterium]